MCKDCAGLTPPLFGVPTPPCLQVRDVTCFDSDVFESLLGPLLHQAAAAAPDTTTATSSSSSSLPSASPYSSSKPSPYAASVSSSKPSPYSSSSSSKPAESTSKSKSRGMLLLSCKSGTVYLLRPGSREHAIPAQVTRVMLPLPLGEGQMKDQGEGAPVGYHHLTLLQGVLCLTEEDKQRGQPRQCSLTLTDLHAIQVSTRIRTHCRSCKLSGGGRSHLVDRRRLQACKLTG